jgi:hypothetical protein
MFSAALSNMANASLTSFTSTHLKQAKETFVLATVTRREMSHLSVHVDANLFIDTNEVMPLERYERRMNTMNMSNTSTV